MTIDKAIAIKEAYLRGHVPDHPYDLIISDLLSIEALKLLLEHRDLDICTFCKPLPGETKE